MLIYYCYSCSEYFKISAKRSKSLDSITCPHCGSFDTEHSPEEENNPDTGKYALADDSIDEDNSNNINEYDAYIEDVESIDD